MFGAFRNLETVPLSVRPCETSARFPSMLSCRPEVVAAEVARSLNKINAQHNCAAAVLPKTGAIGSISAITAQGT